MQLVGHWKQLWKAWSARMMVVALAVPGLIQTMPPDLYKVIEPHEPLIMWTATLVALICRPISQSNITKPEGN